MVIVYVILSSQCTLALFLTSKSDRACHARGALLKGLKEVVNFAPSPWMVIIRLLDAGCDSTDMLPP